MGLLCCMTGGSELDVTFEGNFYTKHEGLVRFRHNFFLSSAQLSTEWNIVQSSLNFSSATTAMQLYNGLYIFHARISFCQELQKPTNAKR